MGTHPIFESDFDCLTEKMIRFLFIMNNDRYEYSSRAFKKAIYQEDTGQLYGDEALKYTFNNHSVYKRVEQNYGQLSNKAKEKFDAYSAALECWKEFEGIELHCKTWHQDAEVRLQRIGQPATELN